MRIGVDGWRLRGRRTGVGTVLGRILASWDDALLPPGAEVTLYTPAPLADEAAAELPPRVRQRVLGPDWDLLPWQTLRLGPAARDDVLFCPSYTTPLVARAPSVVLIYEATHAVVPADYGRDVRWFRGPLHGLCGRRAARVITCTEAARDDIARAYRIPAERIEVVPLAPGGAFRPIEDACARAAARERLLGGPEPFVLHVGKLTKRRNVPALMRAFADFRRRTGSPHRLVVVGLPTMDLDLGALARELGIEGAFHHLDYVPLADLAALYASADAFALPYTYEALSLTALEAQAAGTPVVTTDTPGLREQTGGAALYVDGASEAGMADALTRLTEEPELAADLRRRGIEHASAFTWRRTAAGMLRVLCDVGGAAGAA